MQLSSIPEGGLCVVVGASGGIGGAVADLAERSGRFAEVIRLSRRSGPPLDLLDESSIEAGAATISARNHPVRLIFNATGFLHGDGIEPEKALSRLTLEALQRNFAVNAIGPALLMKHFLPLLPREGRSVFASVTAKVGSISDNRLGGWYSYRAAKAAHNQLLRTAAIETARRRPEAILVALHPGTVASPLSAPFAKSGLNVMEPARSAKMMLSVIGDLTPEDSGTFRSYDGEALPW